MLEGAINLGGAQIRLQQVQLREDILIDEIQLNGKSARYETYQSEGKSAGRDERSYHLLVEEADFTAMMTEPNLNRLLAANMPADAPVRNVRLQLLSGKVKVTGQVVKSVISLPFTVEAVPMVDNGVRVKLDFQAARIGIKMPGPVLDVIEQFVGSSLSLDLSRLPIPVRLSEIRCEPGRLTVKGNARITWPPAVVAPPPAPFSALERPLPGPTLIGSRE